MMSYTSSWAKITHLSFPHMSHHYYLCYNYWFKLCSELKSRALRHLKLDFPCWLCLYPISLNKRWCNRIHLTVLSACDCCPDIPLPSGPAEQLLSQERLRALDCWVTFRGRLLLSPKKHNIQAVDCKRRNFGQENCSLLCLHGHNTGCNNAHRLPQSLRLVRPCASGQKPQLLDPWRLQGWRPQRKYWDWNMWLSAIGKSRGGPVVTVVFQDPEIPFFVPVTQQLRLWWVWQAKHCSDNDSAAGFLRS